MRIEDQSVITVAYNMTTSLTDFDELQSELEKKRPDFEKVRQSILSNKDLLNKPINEWNEYVLHVAIYKEAPSDIIIDIINGNPLAVQQRDISLVYPLHGACRYNQSESVVQLLVKLYPLALQEGDISGWLPLHYACSFYQSHSVIQFLVKEYPLAVQLKRNDRSYPLHMACSHNQPESVIKLLVKEYPLAVQERNRNGSYPLHCALINKNCDNVILTLVNIQAAMEENFLHEACEYSTSERVLLVLINLNLHVVKQWGYKLETPLCIAKRYEQSATIIKVLEQLMIMSQFDLENGIGIPKIVTLHALDNLRRFDTFRWVQYNSPIVIDGKYKQIQ